MRLFAALTVCAAVFALTGCEKGIKMPSKVETEASPSVNQMKLREPSTKPVNPAPGG